VALATLEVEENLFYDFLQQLPKRLRDNMLPLKRKNQQWFDRLAILSEVEGTIFSG